MPKFFYEKKEGDILFLSASDSTHLLRVLRRKKGDVVSVSGLDGMDYQAVIVTDGPGQVALQIVEESINQREPSVHITLYQALPKGDKLPFIIQKAVELGVSEIVPVLTHRCVSRPDAASMRKKIDRFQKIAQEAAKQSQRGKIPQIQPMLSWEEAIQHAKQQEISLLCYEKGGERLSSLVKPTVQSIGLMIGSEGGFEEYEVEQAGREGIKIATLGKLILRCETAPIVALSILMHLTDQI